jgi:hypothetical protein
MNEILFLYSSNHLIYKDNIYLLIKFELKVDLPLIKFLIPLVSNFYSFTLGIF